MYVGLDLGTSGLRALLVDDAGTPHASANAAIDTAHPHPGWSEQDPDDWIRAARAALAELRRTDPVRFGAVRGIGLSGHMHGATLIDVRGAALRACMMWNDTRSHAEAARLDAIPAFRTQTGNIVFPGFTAPKVAWVERHEPEVFARIDRILLPKDYLRLWLTGLAVSDVSDSAGTAWLDVGARVWSSALLEACNLRLGQMPELAEGTDATGVVRPALAAELGLPAGVVVAGGGGDHAAAACGAGALNDGDGFVSLGTSGVLLAARSGFAPRPETAVHTFCHAVPARWYQMGVILAATDSLNWLARLTGQRPEALVAELGDTPGRPGTARFLPYLSGERTPHNDSAIRASLTGLDIAMERTDLTRAVLEGVSFALRDSAEALRATGARLDRVLAIGGGTRSRYWTRLLATVLDLPLDLPAQGEFGAALGAARLAICAVTGASPETVMTRPAVAETILPDAALAEAYGAAHAAYAASYIPMKALP